MAVRECIDYMDSFKQGIESRTVNPDYWNTSNGRKEKQYALDTRDWLIIKLTDTLDPNEEPVYENVGEDDGHIWIIKSNGISVDIFIEDYSRESGFIPPAEWNLIAHDNTQRKEYAA